MKKRMTTQKYVGKKMKISFFSLTFSNSLLNIYRNIYIYVVDEKCTNAPTKYPMANITINISLAGEGI